MQGARKPPLAPVDELTPHARLFAEHRLLGIEDAVATALVAWARGERDVELGFAVPAARALLALQARGKRCVTLLDDDAQAAPHADGLAFAAHDLCHLEKFVDPATHLAQVGFFARMHEAMDRTTWRDLAARLDDTWARDGEHVIADMNGSPVFLVAALKMKLKMASRRALAQARGAVAPSRGPLDDAESRFYGEALAMLLDAWCMHGVERDAAMRVDATRAHREDARVVLAYFERLGGEALAHSVASSSASSAGSLAGSLAGSRVGSVPDPPALAVAAPAPRWRATS